MFQIKPFFVIAGLCSLLALGGCGGGLDPNPGGNGPTTLSARLSNSDFYDSPSSRYYDIFVADALETGTARVAMRSDDFDTQFYVYEKGSDGEYTLIDSNDDADSSTTDSDDRFDVTYGNTYRILATSSLSDDQGSYQIRFSSELSKPAQVTTQDQVAKSSKKFSLPARSKK
ncbi:hypothetical protein IAD21_01861 [Abditibacteriota bacterium]|nr:hypothetical protein IAD21_01861 [Abditibacteriota bacterium]